MNHLRAWLTILIGSALLVSAPSLGASTRRPLSPVDAALARVDSLLARGNSPAAVLLLDSLLAESRTRGDARLETSATIRRAAIRAWSGAFREADSTTREWLPHARAAHDTALVCRGLRTLGFVGLMRQRYPEAAVSFEEMLRLARVAHLPVLEGYARIGTSYLALLAGRYTEAERGYRRSLVLLGAFDAASARTARAGLANTLLSAGRVDAARVEYERVLAESRASGDVRNLADALNDLAAIEFTHGDPSLAIPYYREAAVLQQRVGHAAFALVAWTNVAAGELALGHDQAGSALLDSVATAAAATGARDVLALALDRLAIHRLSSGDDAEAEALGRRVIAMGDSIQVGNWVDGVGNSAEALIDLGRPEEARQLLETALRTRSGKLAARSQSRLVTTLGSADLAAGDPVAALEHLRAGRTLAMSREHVPAIVILDVEGAIARVFLATGHVDSALTHLRAGADAWETARVAPKDPTWKEAFGGAAERIYGLYAAALLDSRRGGTTARRAAEAFATLQSFRARSFEDGIRGFATRGALPRVSPGDFQHSTLRPGEVFLDFYPARDTSFLFAVTRDSIRAVGLPSIRSLSRRLQRFADVLARPGGASLFDAAASELGRDLLGGVASLVRPADVVMISAGKHARRPLGMLRLPGEDEPLCARRTVAIVPSATVLASTRSRSVTGIATTGVLVLGRSTDDEGAKLEGVARECRWLAHSISGIEVRENDGRRSLADMTSGLGHREVLHVASHARGTSNAPWRTALLLGRGTDEGAYLTASRIAALDHPARLWVLSGCATAGASNSAEALPSLAGACLTSGASAVVASLWAVGDDETERLVEDFYGALARGRTAGEALADAQRLARRRQPDSPRGWAGFLLFGDPATRVRLPRR